MATKPTYAELAGKVKELEEKATRCEQLEEELRDANMQLEATNLEFDQIMEQYNQLHVDSEILGLELHQIFNTSADGMWVIDENHCVRRVNEALLQLLGKREEETVGRKCHELFDGSACRKPGCSLVRLKGGESRVECDIEGGNGSGAKKPFILTATPFWGIDGELAGIVEVLKDITERKKTEAALQRANQELRRLAMIDGLTQVANRRHFDECFHNEWRRMKREKSWLSLIMGDVDYFKLFNDSYGHQLGDDCLRAVAQAISDQVGRASDLVARYGGEEFVVLLPNTDAEGAVKIAEAIRRGVQQLNIAHCRSDVCPLVTLSLGVSSLKPRKELSPAVLLEATDQALYEAKALGRNQVVLKTVEV